MLLFYNLHPNVTRLHGISIEGRGFKTDQLFLRLKTKIKNQSRIGEVAKVGCILQSLAVL